MENTKQKRKEEERDTGTLLDNMRFYKEACEVPKDAQKPIQAGRLKGKSDINPMWRIRKLTEIFGPCGFGWRYEIDKQWTEVYGPEVKCFCNITLYVKDPETKEWSHGIPGIGGSAIVTKEKNNGLYVDDDGYKKALTDALSIAMKALGVAGNIWYGPKAEEDIDSKYYSSVNQAQQSSQTKEINSSGITIEQMIELAIKEISTATTEDKVMEIWNKWYKNSPAICGNGSKFYNYTTNKIAQLRGML